MFGCGLVRASACARPTRCCISSCTRTPAFSPRAPPHLDLPHPHFHTSAFHTHRPGRACGRDRDACGAQRRQLRPRRRRDNPPAEYRDLRGGHISTFGVGMIAKRLWTFVDTSFDGVGWQWRRQSMGTSMHNTCSVHKPRIDLQWEVLACRQPGAHSMPRRRLPTSSSWHANTPNSPH